MISAKNISIMLSSVLLTGCLTIPSFYDDNESKASIDVRHAVAQLDCTKDQVPQAMKIKERVDWFSLYVESKGSRDVAKMVKPLKETVDDFYKRGGGSEAYCDSKKKILEKQSLSVANAVMGRF